MTRTKEGTLLKAFSDSLDVMGEQGEELFIKFLSARGLDLNNLTIPLLAHAIKELYGDHFSEIIMKRVMIKLEEMADVALIEQKKKDSFKH